MNPHHPARFRGICWKKDIHALPSRSLAPRAHDPLHGDDPPAVEKPHMHVRVEVDAANEKLARVNDRRSPAFSRVPRLSSGFPRFVRGPVSDPTSGSEADRLLQVLQDPPPAGLPGSDGPVFGVSRACSVLRGLALLALIHHELRNTGVRLRGRTPCMAPTPGVAVNCAAAMSARAGKPAAVPAWPRSFSHRVTWKRVTPSFAGERAGELEFEAFGFPCGPEVVARRQVSA